MQSVTFHVPGKPQGKARARTFYNPAAGKHVSHTPDNTVLYENLIKGQFLSQSDGFYLERGMPAALRIWENMKGRGQIRPEEAPPRNLEELEQFLCAGTVS